MLVSTGDPPISWTSWLTGCPSLFQHTRRRSTAAGVNDFHPSADPLSSCWRRTRRNIVLWHHLYDQISAIAQTQPIRAQRLCHRHTKRSNYNPETVEAILTDGLRKVHFLLIKPTNDSTFNSPLALWLFSSWHRWQMFACMELKDFLEVSFYGFRGEVLKTRVLQWMYWSGVDLFSRWSAAILIMFSVTIWRLLSLLHEGN